MEVGFPWLRSKTGCACERGIVVQDVDTGKSAVNEHTALLIACHTACSSLYPGYPAAAGKVSRTVCPLGVCRILAWRNGQCLSPCTLFSKVLKLV